MRLNPNWVYAIVGASNDPSKYGHIVMKDLMEAGFSVVPINPKGGTILGERVYPSFEFYEDDIDIAVMVVPPGVTEKMVQECARAGIKRVWMQPGSESDAAVRFCEKHGIKCVHGQCIMVARRLQPLQ